MKIVSVWNIELCVRQVIGVASCEENAELIIMAHMKKAAKNLDIDTYEEYRVEDYEIDTLVYDLGI